MKSEAKSVVSQALFEEAEQHGLWFYTSYQQLWLSPQKLREEQAKGNFLWGAVKWQLRNPHEKLIQLEKKAVEIHKEIGKLKYKLSSQ